MRLTQNLVAALCMLVLAGCNENPSGPADESWAAAAARVTPSVYCLGFIEDGRLVQLATGFAIGDSLIATNGHVVRALEEVLEYYSDTLTLVAVESGGDVATGKGVHELKAYAAHPGYVDTAEIESFDFGIVTTTTRLPAHLRFETTPVVQALAAGDGVATVGFPGELGFLYDYSPVATFKDGTVAALRALDGAPPSPGNGFYLQHNLHLSPGTSGSPIFNRAGNVVAVNNSGIVTVICLDDFSCVDIPGSVGFGIRADGFGPALAEDRLLFEDVEYQGDPGFENVSAAVTKLRARRGR